MLLGDIIPWIPPLHAAVTCFMAGVIMVVQVVHYPLFRLVGDEHFAAYHRAHVRQITKIVGPAMAAELILAAGLFWPALEIGGVTAGLGLLLVLAIWGLTAFVHVPQHTGLSDSIDAPSVESLVRWNWVRTALWQIRGLLALSILM
jgi:uncharacterized membrane protein